MWDHGGMSADAARRVAWAVFAVALGLLLADVALAWQTRNIDAQSGLGGSAGNAALGLAFALVMLAFPIAGILIASRRPETPIGWLLLAIGVGWGIANESYSDYGLLLHPGSLPGAALIGIVGSVMWAPTIGLTGTYLLLLFPDGRLPGRRWRIVGYVSVLGIVVGTGALLVTPGPMTSGGYRHSENPLGIAALHGVTQIAQFALVVIPLGMVASAASLVVRFRRAGLVERQQIKWLATAATVVAATYLVVMPVSALVNASWSAAPGWIQVGQAVALLSFGLIPTAIAIAVLRHGLYTIDVIVRKTLVYAALVACLALLYAASVYTIDSAVRTISGASGTLAVSLSTLVAVIAFQPLRSRIQRAVDRRFYRARYDAIQILESFGGRLRDHVDLETLREEVLEVVTETLHPTHVALWLRPTGERS
jgi:MFS family permease